MLDAGVDGGVGGAELFELGDREARAGPLHEPLDRRDGAAQLGGEHAARQGNRAIARALDDEHLGRVVERRFLDNVREAAADEGIGDVLAERLGAGFFPYFAELRGNLGHHAVRGLRAEGQQFLEVRRKHHLVVEENLRLFHRQEGRQKVRRCGRQDEAAAISRSE